MTTALMSLAEATFRAEQRSAACMANAKRILGRYSVQDLVGARVYATEEPDITNPGGYWNRWVILERPVLFGRLKWRTILYYEFCTYHEDDQMRVLKWAKGVVDAINAD